MSFVPPHQLLEQVEREERDARLRLAAARDQGEGGEPHAHHKLIQKLDAEWKHALERLHQTRQSAPD